MGVTANDVKVCNWGYCLHMLATFVTNIVERSTGNAWYGRGTGIVVATISGFVLYLFVRWSNKDGEK